MRTIKLKDHLSVEEIEKRYRGASDGVARSQWQIIWLLACGKSSREIEATTGYSLTWIRTIARRYNAEGSVGDKRHENPGRQAALSVQQQQKLRQELAAAQERHENWNGKRVAQWMSEQLGRPIHMQRGYDWLAKFKHTPQVPRPEHNAANEQDQRVFKKSSRSR